MEIKIWQIYFAKWQLATLDPDFIPYDNSPCPTPDLREFYVFRKEYLEGRVPADAYAGYFSWKFKEKTGMTGKEFESYCQANPGYDVYFVNPFPLEIHYGNVWLQGEASHSNKIVKITQKIFDKIGYKTDLRTLPANLRTAAFCNFWVGNKKFWDGYMSFCLPIWDYIFNEMPANEKAELFSIADKERKASYFSFVFERLFTTYLLTNPNIKSLAYKYDEKFLELTYSKEEAAIILEMQRLEEQFPNEIEPSRKSGIVTSALHYYHLSRVSEPTWFLAMKVFWRISMLSKVTNRSKVLSMRKRLKVTEPGSIWENENRTI